MAQKTQEPVVEDVLLTTWDSIVTFVNTHWIQ